MTTTTRDGSNAFKAAVKVAESACSLPAVATQDWCDRAAMALLPVVGSGVCLTLLGQLDERGHILRQEATGIAGATSLDVTTTIGRTSSSSQMVPIDPNDASLVRVRTNLAQARELHWVPGPITPGMIRVGTPDKFGINLADHNAALSKRWENYRLHGLLLGVAPLGPGGRAMIVELGSTHAPVTEHEIACLEAVLPLIAKRAIMAIGADPSEASHWLTSREQIILQHLLLGKSVREIAEELGRSPHTVHDHVKSLHRKLNASSRGELVARALGYAEMAGHKAESGATATVHTRIAKPTSQTA